MSTTTAIPDPTSTPTIGVPDAAKILGVSVRHAYAAVEAGEIPAIRVGKRIRIPTARFLATYPDLVAAVPAA